MENGCTIQTVSLLRLSLHLSEALGWKGCKLGKRLLTLSSNHLLKMTCGILKSSRREGRP